ncbi:MAG TPA: glycosyltransferase [Bauldia sp.]|nr:glycosyltransferase [Bauldia sp.]
MRIWFYVGDLLEWLGAGKPVSGVQRVTLELLRAGLLDKGFRRGEFVPCVRGSKMGVRPIPLSKVKDILTQYRNHNEGELHKSMSFSHTIISSIYPIFNIRQIKTDHIIFTGAIWSKNYEDLFIKLNSNRVPFSVLVYDVIPLENPEFVSKKHYSQFLDWLKTTLSLSTNIFVSSQSLSSKLKKLRVIFDIRDSAPITKIPFGTESQLKQSTSKLSPWDDTGLSDNPNGFVLSVGTIDRRKNQLMLVEIWAKLAADEIANLPKLVLAGRLQAGLETLTEPARQLIDGGIVQILEAPPDSILAGLYEDCVFTVFPSLNEGYGLPVVESLCFGKLCVCSDLPEIREFAGDLAWYFDPTSIPAAYETIRLAIESPEKRRSAEQKISREFVPTPWSLTLAAMIAGIERKGPTKGGRHRAAGSADLAPGAATAGHDDDPRPVAGHSGKATG